MTREEAVLAKLDEIEREMKRIGFWDESLDAAQVRQQAMDYAVRQGKSPVGTMPFEHWLQAVFIPNARRAAQEKTLPAFSQVSVMAMRQYDYHSHAAEAERLLQLFGEFDALFVDADPEDAAWRAAAYEQFLSDDSDEDAESRS
jgi:uncharacterized protein YqcC (DUF446 family)